LLVLDTDHVTVLGKSSLASVALLERTGASRDDAVTTIVTVEEQLRGWLSEIHRHTDPFRQIIAQERLRARVEFFAAWTILPWDDDAASQLVNFRRQGVRLGTMDLKIAYITLAHEATLLTRNTGDFAQVPGLRFENWLD